MSRSLILFSFSSIHLRECWSLSLVDCRDAADPHVSTGHSRSIHSVIAWLGPRPGVRQGSFLTPRFLRISRTMVWFLRLGLPSRCGRKCTLDLPGDTLWVERSGRAPKDSPF
eukprot:3928199-Amphidinium_carterae.1